MFLQSEGLMQSGGSEAENRKGHSENRCLNPPEKVTLFLVNPPRKVGDLSSPSF